MKRIYFYTRKNYFLKEIMELSLMLAAVISLTSCKKYLDAKTDKKLVVPTSLQDAQALLDYYTQLNTFYSPIGLASDDDHYLLDDRFNSLNEDQQSIYIWDKDAAYNSGDWKWTYANILYANLALETVEKVPPSSSSLSEWRAIKGSALFFRAYNFFQAVQYWAEPYDKNTADKALGVPLRLTSDVNETIMRPSLEASYHQIIQDYKQAIELLPVSNSILSRPSKPAAFGALSRVYLSMGDYRQAFLYADSCLQLYNILIDYNELNPNAFAPIKSFNKEVIFHSETTQSISIFSPIAKTDSVLYRSYGDNDLRKIVFFMDNNDGTHSFKGSYAGSNYYDVPFNGIATDEMYLIRAECYARSGDVKNAMKDLNALLVKRWKAGTFIPYTADNEEEALKMVLQERRKELVLRGMRWFDLRRLNKDSRFAVTLIRKVNGKTYSLPPNDPRYTFYIPNDVIIKTGMKQNVR